ncbi:hypothetical protein K435DRAFT_777467, partial [Dendrothele bispora CBS 962.96]
RLPTLLPTDTSPPPTSRPPTSRPPSLPPLLPSTLLQNLTATSPASLHLSKFDCNLSRFFEVLPFYFEVHGNLTRFYTCRVLCNNYGKC